MKKVIGMLVAFMCASGLQAATLLEETFETDGQNSRYFSSSEFSSSSEDYYGRFATGETDRAYTGMEGSCWFGGQDQDASGSNPKYLTISNINISGSSDLVFYALFAEQRPEAGADDDIDDNDYVHVQYSVDGGGWTDLLWFENDGAQYNTPFYIDSNFDGDGEANTATRLETYFKEFTNRFSVSGTSLDLRIESSVGSGDEDWAVDNIRIMDDTSAPASNQPPVLASIGNQNKTEGEALTFVVTATDSVDADDFITLYASNLPSGATFGSVSNKVQVTNTFSWAVPVAGVYTSVFYATDKDGTDSEEVVITISAPAPVGSLPAYQGFEGDAGDTWSFTTNPAVYNLSADVWDRVASLSSISAPTGTQFWGIQDLNNPNGGGSFYHTLQFNAIDVSGSSNVVLSFSYYTIGFDSTDYMRYSVMYDSETNFANYIELEKDTSAAWSNVVVNVPDTATVVRLSLEAKQNGGSDYAGWDDVSLSVAGTPVASSNEPPVLDAIGNKSVAVSNLLSFTVSASDSVDSNDYVTLTASNLPAGAVFTTVSNMTIVTNTFSWAVPVVGVYTTTFYAIDKDGTDSETITITVNAGSAPSSTEVWINELHYDNDGIDSGEGVEVAGKAGVNLAGYSLLAYNGNGGTVYDTLDLSGTIDDEGCGYGALWFDISGLQNGSPDGVALVDGSSNVLEFLSYEGVITATDGTANGQSSTDIGVSEPASSPVGYSLQLVGTGTNAAGFTWIAPTNSSLGSLNSDQTIAGCGPTPENEPPVLDAIGNKSVTVSNLLSFVVSATDSVDSNDYVTLTASNLPVGAVFTTVSNMTIVTNTFSWAVPVVGVYTTTFYAIDKDGTDSESIVITVTNIPVPSVYDFIITEVMQNPSAASDADGEYFEVYNNGDSAVDINGWVLTDLGSDFHVISNGAPLMVSTGAYVVLGVDSNLVTNGGTPVDYQYSSFYLSNGDDEIILLDTLSNEVTRIEYDGGIVWPDPAGASMYLTNLTADANNGANWLTSTSVWVGSAGDAGTPGDANDTVYDTSSDVPPVLAPIGNKTLVESNLLSFTVSASDSVDSNDYVTLTASNLPVGAVFTTVSNMTIVTNTFSWAVPVVGVYTTTFYAIDKDGTDSETITITVNPTPSTPALSVWINEIHYDNDGGDVAEGVEIAGAAGTDLTNYMVYAYNGSGGAVYDSIVLGGIIDDEGCGYGALWFDLAGLQNGSPDGIALTDAASNLVQFISYEGDFTATDGPALGLLSEDIGIAESSSTPTNFSLQMTGSATNYAGFTWSGPTNISHGSLNVGQEIAGCGGSTDTDGDGIEDSWEIENFGDLVSAGTNTDSDLDGMLDYAEWLAGTEPTNAASIFQISSAQEVDVTGNIVINFDSVAGREYHILRSTNVYGPYIGIISNVSAIAPANVVTDSAPPAVDTLYYRIKLK